MCLNVMIYLLFFLGDRWCWRLNFRFVCSDCDRGDRGGRDVVFADTAEVYWCLQLYKNRQTSQAWEKKKKYDKFGKGKKNRNAYIQWTGINFVEIVLKDPVCDFYQISVGGELKNCWVQSGSAGWELNVFVCKL